MMTPGGSDTARDEPNAIGQWREWFLMDGDRFRVTGVVLFAIFSVLAIVGHWWLVPVQNVQPLYYVYSGFISGNLTVITVVVAINQLLLSREFNTPSEFESQIDGAMDYRSKVEEFSGQIAPVQPPEFLQLLVGNTRRQARALGQLASDQPSQVASDELDSIVSGLMTQTDRVETRIEESGTSTFEALSTTLRTNYAPQINRLRRVEDRHADELPADLESAIDGLIQRLKAIDIARQYFKTIYLQEELATLSRYLFYVGMASLVVLASGLLLLVGSSGPPVSTPYFTFLVAGSITVGLAPLSLLFAFIVRVAVVTQRTVSTIPFTTTAQEP